MAKPALSAKQRLKLLQKVFKEGESVTSACRDFGVSRFTFYKWAKLYAPEASRNQNLRNLADVKRRVTSSPKIASGKIVEEVKNIASEKPRWSKYKITNELKKRLGDKAIGIHGVYNVLKRTGLNSLEARKKWQDFVLKSKKRTLTPEQRLEVIKRAVELRIPVTEVCRDFAISRFTFYKWKKRWDKIGTIDALRDREHQYDRRNFRVKPELQEEILSVVINFPNLSKYGIARRIEEEFGQIVSPHGVYNVLLRNGLNLPESRLAYSNAQAPELPEPVTWADRLRSVLEQFIPSFAPAPPPASAMLKALRAGPPAFSTIFNFLKAFSITSIITSATIYSLLWWASKLTANITSISIGLVFATIALLMGSLFFLYSLKYYLTLAIVLSFSQQEDSSGERLAYSKKRGFLSWILGLANGNGGKVGLTDEASAKAVGLTPSLENVILKRNPFVSVHIPLFNERKVVERAIQAATNFDYQGDYEVILADDSNDETTQIIEDYLKSSMQNVASSMREKDSAHATSYQLHTTKGDGWTLTTSEIRPGVTLKHLHRTSRSGFKGGALRLALKVCDPRTEFVSVFDADFVPYPDTLELFLKYFQATAGTLDFRRVNSGKWTVDSEKSQNTVHRTLAA